MDKKGTDKVAHICNQIRKVEMNLQRKEKLGRTSQYSQGNN